MKFQQFVGYMVMINIVIIGGLMVAVAITGIICLTSPDDVECALAAYMFKECLFLLALFMISFFIVASRVED